jgi:hypothetical protein
MGSRVCQQVSTAGKKVDTLKSVSFRGTDTSGVPFVSMSDERLLSALKSESANLALKFSLRMDLHAANNAVDDPIGTRTIGIESDA